MPLDLNLLPHYNPRLPFVIALPKSGGVTTKQSPLTTDTFMFENLTERLNQVFDQLRRRGKLSEADVDAAMREVRSRRAPPRNPPP